MICGYLVITKKWFRDDEDKTTQAFTLFTKPKDGNNTICFNKELRKFWLAAVNPVYYIPKEESLFLWLDVKTNPRRIHPFALAYYNFLKSVKDYIKNPAGHPPVLLMRPSDIPFPTGYWRNGLPSTSLHCANQCITTTETFYKALVMIQKWVRAKQRCLHLRLKPDFLFQKNIDSSVRKIRLKKIGISLNSWQCVDRRSIEEKKDTYINNECVSMLKCL